MKSLRFLDRRAGYSLSAIGLLLGMVLPGIFPAFASADNQVTSRSIQLSNSAEAATGVNYSTTFTPVTGDGTSTYYTLVLFCNNSPIVGLSCTAPTGFSASSALIGSGSTSGSSAAVSSKGANYIVFSSKLTSGTPITLEATGVTNPTNPTSSSSGFYGRIETFSSSTNATNAAADGTVTTGVLDDGGVAMAITQSIGVTAYVQESMTFCVSGSGSDGTLPAPGPGCGATGNAVNDPSMTIGQTVGSQKVLQAGTVSTGEDFAQLSTNASHGAIVNLKSSATSCGGLVRVGGVAGNCDIKPQTTAGPISGAFFGLTVGASQNAPGATDSSGSLAPEGSYGPTNYFLDYTAGDTSGVTSTYGSPLFNSTGPVNNIYVPVTFGASITNLTPAGQYGATLDMIAVGTF